MLQQTQAARVVDPYLRFVARFPTPASAARASARELLAAWMGLGYNARALRLREAARRIEAGGWPTTIEALQKLPGVGPYTAAAVACFAFGRQVATPDTNVRRVLSRWVGRPIEGSELAETATRLMPDGEAADWNQAVMDLGSAICRPVPACESCPVVDWCSSPDVYVPPRPQERFGGSVRQARGSILRILVERGSVRRGELLTRSGVVSRSRAEQALESLIGDDLVTEHDGRVSLVR
jgi:A/G-specific adenine glycosylase